jgi:hypothetical protein
VGAVLNTPLRQLWPAAAALVFATLLACLPLEAFKDRENYLAYVANAPLFLLGWLDSDILTILSNEPAWLLTNAALGLWLPQEAVLQLLIFAPAFVVALLVLRTDTRQGLLLLGLLLAPQILKNHVIHLRQGAAIALFLAAYFLPASKTRMALLVVTPFVHSSYFFVLLLMAFAWLLQRSGASRTTSLLTYAMLGLFVSLVLGLVVSASGARQGNEHELVAAQGISGLGFLFWFGIAVFLLLQPKDFVISHLLAVGSIVFYLATYFSSPFAARIFESTLPLVFMTGLDSRMRSKQWFIAALFLYSLLQWLMMIASVDASFFNNE